MTAVWLAIVLLACDLLTWTQTLSLSGPLRVAELKTLRLRLLAIAGRLTRGRRTQLRLDRRWPWAATVAAAVARCAPSPTPADNTVLAQTTRRDPEQRPGATVGNNHTPNTITGERRERRPQPQDHERSRLSLFCSINATPILWLTDFLLYLSELQRQLSYHS